MRPAKRGLGSSAAFDVSFDFDFFVSAKSDRIHTTQRSLSRCKTVKNKQSAGAKTSAANIEEILH